ncbi:hypothetical protein [Bradyrhizobium prioriisuperbiae]|uniref:hypothetical protein n=1 Tax=Bradyrhizobium prioriisuperbiae TaxID=2854389 RepID=UPI0028F0BCDD|nr:hypothetical protein [Bradyrhizobium prioritasuperba]
MRITILATWTLLLGLLAASIAFAVYGIGAMPTEGYLPLTIGAVLTIGFGAGLLGLLVYSSHHGYDDPPHLQG